MSVLRNKDTQVLSQVFLDFWSYTSQYFCFKEHYRHSNAMNAKLELNPFILDNNPEYGSSSKTLASSCIKSSMHGVTGHCSINIAV